MKRVTSVVFQNWATSIYEISEKKIYISLKSTQKPEEKQVKNVFLIFFLSK